MPTLDNVASFEILIALAVIDIVLAGVAWLGFRRPRGTAAGQVLAAGAGTASSGGQLSAGGPGAGGPDAGARQQRESGAEHDDEPVDGATTGDDDGPPRSVLVDPETGLGTALAWDEAMRREDARAARYGHATTIAVFELEGLDRLADLIGAAVADKLIPPVAETLHRNSRAADSLARVGRARFHVLMPETDEIAAINYVDRIRDSADMWLEAGAVAVRVVVGWASPPAGGSLVDALRLADERLQADRRNRARPRPPQRVRTPVAGAAG